MFDSRKSGPPGTEVFFGAMACSALTALSHVGLRKDPPELPGGSGRRYRGVRRLSQGNHFCYLKEALRFTMGLEIMQ